jgi:hypothetical protein
MRIDRWLWVIVTDGFALRQHDPSSLAYTTNGEGSLHVHTKHDHEHRPVVPSTGLSRCVWCTGDGAACTTSLRRRGCTGRTTGEGRAASGSPVFLILGSFDTFRSHPLRAA